MKNQNYIVPLVLLFLMSCDSKPKVLEASSTEAPSQTQSNNENGESHKAVVEEVLQTSKYTYLFLNENGSTYWIAIAKAQVEKGEEVMYTGGLRMHGFQSTELNRVFENLLLVSSISRAGKEQESLFKKLQETPEAVEKEKIIPAKGSIKLSDLWSNPEKYSGKQILVTGRCTKLNLQIMGKNWIHIEDESGSGKDLTITTQDVLPIGKAGTFEGIIALNKDFGSGYRYELIMEEAKLK